ncbi:uncharacterized protein G2W53_014641 [Senna tora]|uniref:Uncharacterized protein n=1 Tax=Senna tora TaxID=362788 RepID=A0A834WTX3_9FABA|nr:uncharacterized protein G2W53_014641 [Senna tora]
MEHQRKMARKSRREQVVECPEEETHKENQKKRARKSKEEQVVECPEEQTHNRLLDNKHRTKIWEGVRLDVVRMMKPYNINVFSLIAIPKIKKLAFRPNAIEKLDVGKDVRDFLRHSGFENVLGLFEEHNMLLVFLYFGLIDSLNILGLPIHGTPILSIRPKDKDKFKSTPENLFPGVKDILNQRGFDLNKLKTVATARKGDDFIYSLKLRVRVTVLCIMGSYIIPSPSSGFLS